MYKPPYNITNKMLNLSISITEKIGLINSFSTLKRMPILRKNNKIKSIHSSLAIEANSLSLSQVKDVIEGKVVLGPKKEIQEVKNAYLAYSSLNTFDGYSEEDLLLGIAEHNRWNMEQLLMGYSPCKKEEDALLTLYVRTNQTEAQHQTKNMLKRSAAKVHPNICDYEHLSKIDPLAKSYDIQLIHAIPRILMMVDGQGICRYQSK